jgi:uroporphyrinogen decarboxylase
LFGPGLERGRSSGFKVDMTSSPESPALLCVLAGETLSPPPVWFMRQAGRSLPEYRALREKAPDFIGFCLNPEMAAEATMQPLRRFAQIDAAILFADILLIPGALGQKVWFEAGEGPRLDPLPPIASLRAEVAASTGRLAAVGETIKLVRKELEPRRALIGFAGAPWTVATYMIQGKGGDREEARRVIYHHPAELDALLDVLVDATVAYLAMQARAGAQVLKLFESWAENLPEDVFRRVVCGPHKRIVEALRALGVNAPVIGFPRGASGLAEIYAAESGVDCVGLDVAASAETGRRIQRDGGCIEGALDPLLLRAGGPALEARIDALKAQWGAGPWIFNLGHGVLPDTPIAHLEQALARIKAR